ncbi:hypothetical protein [Streptomyces eurythermus]
MNPFARSLPGAGLIRAFLLTWLSVVMSACGHSVATGAPPSWGALTRGSAAVALLVTPLARRRLTILANAGVLAALQIGLHAYFSVTMPTAPMPHSMSATHQDTAPPPWMADLPAIPMLCGHLVAAAGVAWLLRGGDMAMAHVLALARLYGSDAVRHVLHASRGRLLAQRGSHMAIATLIRPTVPRWEAAPPGSRPLLAHEVTRRGPPRRMAALG